jgi:chromosome condensin MukBEF ATPase and DNA-binding subunit MukB
VVLHYATGILSCNSFSVSHREVVVRFAKQKYGSVRAHEVPLFGGGFRQSLLENLVERSGFPMRKPEVR